MTRNTASQEEPKFTLLVEKIAPGSRLVRTWPLKGGISALMTAFEIERPGGQTQKMILRRPGKDVLLQNPRAAEDEYRILQMARSSGLAAPAPLYLDQSGLILPAPYLVIEYIEGSPEFTTANLANFTTQLAVHLAGIHRVDCSRLGATYLPKLAGELDHAPGSRIGILDPSFKVERTRDSLEAAWPLRQHNTSVLLHGDYWPGNILWQDGQLVAVIDWEDAACGDPLYDLAISRLDIIWIFGREAMRTFTSDYQSMMAIDYTHLPYWDLNAALRLTRLVGLDRAGWAASFHSLGRPDITKRTILEHYYWFVDQALEKLPR